MLCVPLAMFQIRSSTAVKRLNPLGRRVLPSCMNCMGRARCFRLCQPGKAQTWLMQLCCHICATQGSSCLCTGCKRALLWVLGARTGQSQTSAPQGPSRSLMGSSCDMAKQLMAQRYHGEGVCRPMSAGRHLQMRDMLLIVPPLLATAAKPQSWAELLINCLKFRGQQILPLQGNL